MKAQKGSRHVLGLCSVQKQLHENGSFSLYDVWPVVDHAVITCSDKAFTGSSFVGVRDKQGQAIVCVFMEKPTDLEPGGLEAVGMNTDRGFEDRHQNGGARRARGTLWSFPKCVLHSTGPDRCSESAL